MKINVALFYQDELYAERLADIMQKCYSREITIRLFSDQQLFLSEISNQHFDLLLVEQERFFSVKADLEQAVLAVLVTDQAIARIENRPAIGKYQKLENIYKQILDISAENSSVQILKADGGKKISTVLFTSSQGGAGTSAVAIAYALAMKQQGKRVFYLNLEDFSSTNDYFSEEGLGTFSDVIYAIKSQKVNLQMKLQATIRSDAWGVDYIAGCINAYDMQELKDSEIQELLNCIYSFGKYDLLVLDYSIPCSERQLLLMNDYADAIVCVNDGSLIGNRKFLGFCEVLKVMEMRQQISIIDKMSLLYNRFSSKTSTQLSAAPVPILGGISRVEGVSGRQLIETLSREDVFDRI